MGWAKVAEPKGAERRGPIQGVKREEAIRDGGVEGANLRGREEGGRSKRAEPSGIGQGAE